jgi:hypothetical protein
MDSISWPHVLYLSGCSRPGSLSIMSLPLTVRSLIATDHRCNCFTDHCRTSWPGKKLQLGWEVSLLSSSLLGLIPIFFLSSYLLAASALAPLYGKLSDLIGRKPVLYFAISSFLVSDVTFPHLCSPDETPIVGFCALRRRTKLDMVNYLSGRPRNRWRWPHTDCSNHHLRHRFSTRVRSPFITFQFVC